MYFEIDSFLPEKEVFEFLRPSSYRVMFTGDIGAKQAKAKPKTGFRLKTVKLRGQVSQGLALPISLFPEIENPKIQDDVTEVLSVIKWEAEPEEGFTKGEIPGVIQKSDQTRIQVLLDFFEKHKEIKFEETLKLDGASTTIYFNNGEFGVCGKNVEYERNINTPAWKEVINLNLEEILIDLNLNIALQCELMGPGIQKNKDKLSKHELYLYNIQDLNTYIFLTPKERMELFNIIKDRIFELTGIEFKHSPILNEDIAIFSVYNTLEGILKHSEGKSINASKREGVVFKSIEKVNGEIIQFKVISNSFLLSEKE